MQILVRVILQHGVRTRQETGALVEAFGQAATVGLDSEIEHAFRHGLTDCDRQVYATVHGVFAHHDGAGKERLAALSTPARFQAEAHDPNSTPQKPRPMETPVVM